MLKKVITSAALIPLLLHLPYLLQAWSSSRLDKLDWIFYPVAAAAAVWALRKTGKGKWDFYALFCLIPLLLLSITTPLHQINAIGVAAAAGVLFSAVWLTFSWDLAYQVLPAAVILLLGTPSSSYQLSLLMMCPVWMAWAVKFVLALLCFLWIWCNQRFGIVVKKGNIFFLAAVLGTGFLLLHTKEIYFKGNAFIPEFPARAGSFWGRKLEPDANTKRFFATADVAQYNYTRNNVDISVLSVHCGKDIHEIHPASHCLRTNYWTVLTERILYLPDKFAVTEIDAEKGSSRVLVWVWYSGKDFSTPGFLGFRRHFRPGGDYYTCQISVPVYESVEKSRKELHDFVNSLKEDMRK